MKREHAHVCDEYFEGVLFSNRIQRTKKTMAFYYVPTNWKNVSAKVKLLLVSNYLILIFLLFKFLAA